MSFTGLHRDSRPKSAFKTALKNAESQIAIWCIKVLKCDVQVALNGTRYSYAIVAVRLIVSFLFQSIAEAAIATLTTATSVSLHLAEAR